MFLLLSVRHVGAHPDGHQHGVSIQISINLGKTFLRISRYGIFFWPESWRGSLYIYLLSFPRFWTLSIERFWFLFWSILNDVTLKTSNWGIFGFTICAWVRHFEFAKVALSRSWVTTHPWSRLGCSSCAGQIFDRIGWKCHHVFGAQI